MSEQTQFELFAFWRSSAAFRVRVALNLKGLSAHEQNIDLDAGEQRSDAFLKISPLGSIPALVQEGHEPLTQSLAILEFLDELQPSPPLLPSDLYGRARVRSIASMCTADTHPLIVPRVKKYLLETGGFDDAAWRAWRLAGWAQVSVRSSNALRVRRKQVCTVTAMNRQWRTSASPASSQSRGCSRSPFPIRRLSTGS